MSFSPRQTLLSCCCLLTGFHCVFSADYPGAKIPGLKPLIFARAVVSTEDNSEFTVNFNPRGTELYFTRREGGDGRATIHYMKFEDGAWTAPRPVDFSGSDFDYHSCLSRDGKRLYFGSDRPLEGQAAQNGAPSVWFVRRTGRNWSDPIHLGALLDNGRAEFLSITNRETLYFGEWIDGQESSLHRSRRRGGRYPAPERLPTPPNSNSSDAHPLIAPDESFVIFDSTRPGGRGAGDLYLSFRTEDDSWTEPLNLGRGINSAAWEVAPTLSHDGKYFFFHRGGNILWVDAKALGIFRLLIAAHSDYDGDGTSDLALFNPTTGKWRIQGIGIRKFGKPHSIAVPGDFDGNGRTDLAYFFPEQGLWKVRGGPTIRNFGIPGDVPVPGDCDGDGTTDIAFFRPSSGTWHFARQDVDRLRAHTSQVSVGRLGDLPVPADYDGNGTTDIAIFRPSTRQWVIDGQGTKRFGKGTDSPVPADFDGDGAAAPAYFDPATRTWNVWNQFETRYGAAGDVPLVLGH